MNSPGLGTRDRQYAYRGLVIFARRRKWGSALDTGHFPLFVCSSSSGSDQAKRLIEQDK